MGNEWYYSTSPNDTKGPVAEEHIRSMIASGSLPAHTMIWSPVAQQWLPLPQVAGQLLPPPGVMPAQASYPPPGMVQAPYPQAGMPVVEDPNNLARRIADYERLSGILWMVLGIILILTCAGFIAGAWNIFAATSRFKRANLVRARDPQVPTLYENDMTGIIIIILVNFFLGGVLGVGCGIFDLYIRDQVLKNAHVFTGTPYATPVSLPR